jgi:hypothetical protein
MHERREQDSGDGPPDEHRWLRRQTREADAVMVWLVERETSFDVIIDLAACCGAEIHDAAEGVGVGAGHARISMVGR